MLRVYTKIKGKLAGFDVDTNDIELAIKTVGDSLGAKHKEPILVRIK